MNTEQEKFTIKEFFKDFYNLQIKYLYISLDDNMWNTFISETDNLVKKYKQHGDNIDKFVRGCLKEMVEYKERREKQYAGSKK